MGRSLPAQQNGTSEAAVHRFALIVLPYAPPSHILKI